MATTYDDPAYASYLNALGFNQKEAKTQAQRARSQAVGTYDQAKEGLQLGHKRTLRDVDYNMENRGIFRSGERIRRRGDATTDYTRSTGALNLQHGNRMSDIEDNLRRQLAQMTIDADSQTLAASMRAGERAAAGMDAYTGDVIKAYMATLGRAPDAFGLKTFGTGMQQGADYDAVVRGLRDSPEFRNNATQQVTAAYKKILGRAPDAFGLKGFVDGMVRGEIPDVAALERALRASPEGRRKYGG